MRGERAMQVLDNGRRLGEGSVLVGHEPRQKDVAVFHGADARQPELLHKAILFHPSDEQLAIQASLKGTLEQSFPPERRAAFLGKAQDFDRPSWGALMALGLGGLAAPEDLGGAGLGLVDLAMAVETLGYGAAPGPLIEHLAAGLALASSPAEAVKAQWLPELVAGETVATLALGGDWLPEHWAIRFEDGRITGEAAFVPCAKSANVMLIGVQGGGLALAGTASQGVSITARPSSDGTRPVFGVTFDRAPADLVHAPGSAGALRAFEAMLVLVAADALGGAQYGVDLSVDYAKVREQFGQPIGRFQALKHQLAGMALEVEPARALVWYAAYAHDARSSDAGRAASLAKAHLCDRYVAVTRAAVAAHGGVGYTWDYPLHMWFRRALFDRAYLGAPSLHRARAADLAGW